MNWQTAIGFVLTLCCLGCVQSNTENISYGCEIQLKCSDGGEITCRGSICKYTADDPIGVGHVTCDSVKTACNRRK